MIYNSGFGIDKCLFPRHVKQYKVSIKGIAKYLKFKILGKFDYMHRHLFRWYNCMKAIPVYYQVHHTCNNKHCCNPEHLELVHMNKHSHMSNVNRHSDKREKAYNIWNESNGNIKPSELAKALNLKWDTANRYINELKSGCFKISYLLVPILYEILKRCVDSL